jgi:hypothetical protein
VQLPRTFWQKYGTLNFITKSQIWTKFVKAVNSAIAPHFLAKVRDTEFYNQITDLDKIREGTYKPGKVKK